MGLPRLLIFILIAAAVYWLVRIISQKAIRKPSAHKTEDAAEAMVKCQYCGVHLPQHKAVSNNQKWYCSQQHLEQDNSAD
jgi:uncharacterized protein